MKVRTSILPVQLEHSRQTEDWRRYSDQNPRSRRVRHCWRQSREVANCFWRNIEGRDAGKVYDPGEGISLCGVALDVSIATIEFLVRYTSLEPAPKDPIGRVKIELMGHRYTLPVEPACAPFNTQQTGL